MDGKGIIILFDEGQFNKAMLLASLAEAGIECVVGSFADSYEIENDLRNKISEKMEFEITREKENWELPFFDLSVKKERPCYSIKDRFANKKFFRS